MAVAVDIQAPDASTWAAGEERFQVLAPLAAVERTTRAEVEAAARDLGIGRAYCYRLLRRLRAERTVTAVLPRSRGFISFRAMRGRVAGQGGCG